MRKPMVFTLGIFTGLFVAVGCASTFPWPYYAPRMADACYDQGILLGKPGKGGWPNVPMSDCKPDPEPSPGASPSTTPVRLKCMVVKIDDFYSVKADDENCHKELQACQHGPEPQP